MAKSPSAPSRNWRSIIGLFLLYIAILFNLEWIWGILFLLWVIPDIFSGVTYFIEPVTKNDNPFLYWLIIVTWLLLSMYSLLLPFFPQLATF
ncbi:MAG: hypothetical protein AAF242_04555 [Bacteroidota bacterium]